MQDLQKIGGLAALTAAGTNLLGAAVFAVVLEPKGFGAAHPDPDRVVRLLVDNELAMQVWFVVIFLAFSACVLVLTGALADRMRHAPAVRTHTDAAQAVVVIGVVYAALVMVIGALSLRDLATVVRLYHDDPARAADTWTALDAVESGLGAGGGETLLSAVWFGALSWVALRLRALPKPVNVVGFTVAAAGVVTVVTGLTATTAVYAVGLIVWFVWVGVVLVRTPPMVDRTESGVLFALERGNGLGER